MSPQIFRIGWIVTILLFFVAHRMDPGSPRFHQEWLWDASRPKTPELEASLQAEVRRICERQKSYAPTLFVASALLLTMSGWTIQRARKVWWR